MERRDEKLEAVVNTAGVLTAGGVLTFALFPLLLPTVVLLGVLALPLLPLAVAAALLAGIYLPLRALVRLMRRGRRGPQPPQLDEAQTTRTLAARGPLSPDSAS